MPLLFAIDKSKKQNVIFRYEPKQNRWYVEFEEQKEGDKKGKNLDKKTIQGKKKR